MKVKLKFFVLSLVGVLVMSVATSSFALPMHPYGPWRIDCMDKTNQTIRHPDGTMRAVSPSETWSSELQNAADLSSSSVRCWCKSPVQHEWDTEELGSVEGWWSMTKHLIKNGDTCTCSTGSAVMVEMDHNTCMGTEDAHGFFHCSGCPASSSSATTSSTSWVVVIGAGGALLSSLFN